MCSVSASLTSDLVGLDEAGEHGEEDGRCGGLGVLSEVLHHRPVRLLEHARERRPYQLS